MKLSDFDYNYPEELVAQRPAARRDASRMMVANRSDQSFTHGSIQDLPDYLQDGDLVVVNDTKVLPMRLYGHRHSTSRFSTSSNRNTVYSSSERSESRSASGSRIEILLLKEIDRDEKVWLALATRKKRLKAGDQLTFDDNLIATILENRFEGILLQFQTDQSIEELLPTIGLPPLPPYIQRKERSDYTEEDHQRYQTIYAKHIGSAAAPTAGFHLTETIVNKCRARGTEIIPITLHVGIDTFSPVRVEKILDHEMHGEEYRISDESVGAIRKAKDEGRRVIAIGTTTVRALESFAPYLTNNQKTSTPEHQHTNQHQNTRTPEYQNTNLFITPGYTFKIVDAMLTNFHQPKSTLLMMVSAFAGKDFIFRTYKEAIREKYRLFSYGDCMLIL